MPQRNCIHTLKKSFKQSKTIILPIEMPSYRCLVEDKDEFRLFLDHMIAQLPELYPEDITHGYHLHDKRVSKKLEDVVIRRIKLVQPDKEGKSQVYSIVPSAVLPYMSGMTDEVEKALFLLRFGVPFWALTYVFGRDDSYWYRQHCHFGRYGIVETTIQDKNQIPEHLLADEKHSRINGEKCYIATTVGDDCVLGAAVSMSASEKSLTAAYKTVKEEVELFDDEYQPQTVNTDGWFATQNAWLTLFPQIVIIECFLHAYISIRVRCKRKYKAVWGDIQEKVWDIYHSTSAITLRSEVSKEWVSPAHKLNGKKYHDNWLHNLLISTSSSPVLLLSHKKQ